MELHPLVRHEWADDHWLSRRSLIWISEHADPGDSHPLVTAVAQLRAESMVEVGRQASTDLHPPPSSGGDLHPPW